MGRVEKGAREVSLSFSAFYFLLSPALPFFALAQKVVRMGGFEPPWAIRPLGPEPSASACSATSALFLL